MHHDTIPLGIVVLHLLTALQSVFGSGTWPGYGLLVVAGGTLAALVAWLAWEMAHHATDDLPDLAYAERRQATTAALLAGSLTATSLPLLMLSGRVSGPGALGLMSTMVALAATWRALAARRLAWLAVAAVLWGVALATYPAALGPLAGTALWAALQPTTRAWLQRPLAWLALAATALAYAALTAMPHLVVGPLAGSGSADPVGAPVWVAVWLVGLAMVGALALMWATRSPTTAVLPLAALGTVLALPLVNLDSLSLAPLGYVAPAIVLVYLAVGLDVASLVTRLPSARARAVVMIGIALLILSPLVGVVGL